MAKYKTKDALLKNRPNRIPRDQWTGFVTYWLSDKAKVTYFSGVIFCCYYFSICKLHSQV
jgi:hypothetical protein